MKFPYIKTEKNKKWFTCVIVAICFVLLFIGSAWEELYKNSKNTVSVEMVDVQLLSVKNHTVTQELRLEGELKNLILFSYLFLSKTKI